ncbi:hypothetical protein N7507_004957 [Penicillium longicatenatum]|nr:hypothetical protein N7507_004957 [Penicillium longicatenatum]
MTSTSGSGLLSPLKQVHNAVNPSTQSSRQNTPLHQDKIKADSSAVSFPGCEELVQLYKKVAVDLSSQLETEANDMELGVQSHDVQHLLTRIKYWKAEARFHLQQRMLEIGGRGVLNERLNEHQHLELKIEESGADVKKMKVARKQ